MLIKNNSAIYINIPCFPNTMGCVHGFDKSWVYHTISLFVGFRKVEYFYGFYDRKMLPQIKKYLQQYKRQKLRHSCGSFLHVLWKYIYHLSFYTLISQTWSKCSNIQIWKWSYEYWDDSLIWSIYKSYLNKIIKYCNFFNPTIYGIK